MAKSAEWLSISTKGNKMTNEHSEQEKEIMRQEDSKLDAIAAVVIILSLVAAAVFWVSNQ